MPTIAKIEVFPVRLPMKKLFSFASGTAGTFAQGAPHVFVKVTDSDGAFGWGECRPVPGWSYETLETVVTTLKNYVAPAVVGRDVWDRGGIFALLNRVVGQGVTTGQPIARAAFDMALHDLCATLAGVSLRQFVGGSGAKAQLDFSYTLTEHSVEEVRRAIENAQNEGFKHFNFKPGVDLSTDAEVAHAIREAAGPDAFVWADANGGLQLHQARKLAKQFYEVGVDVLEQPLAPNQLLQMKALREGCPIPLAVDEASVSASDFFQHAAAGLVDYFVLKVTRSGGIWPSLDQLAVMRAAGLPFIVSGLTDGLLTKVAAGQLAAAFGTAGPLALNGSQFVDDTALFPQKEEFEHGGTLFLPDTPGIGVAPDEAALQKFAAEM